jgi:hypothetical protein
MPKVIISINDIRSKVTRLINILIKLNKLIISGEVLK